MRRPRLGTRTSGCSMPLPSAVPEPRAGPEDVGEGGEDEAVMQFTLMRAHLSFRPNRPSKPRRSKSHTNHELPMRASSAAWPHSTRSRSQMKCATGFSRCRPFLRRSAALCAPLCGLACSSLRTRHHRNRNYVVGNSLCLPLACSCIANQVLLVSHQTSFTAAPRSSSKAHGYNSSVTPPSQQEQGATNTMPLRMTRRRRERREPLPSSTSVSYQRPGAHLLQSHLLRATRRPWRSFKTLPAAHPSHTRQCQHIFWTSVRNATASCRRICSSLPSEVPGVGPRPDPPE